MKQLVNIGIGQAGIQISQTLLELYAQEHQIHYDGKRRQETIKNQSSVIHDRNHQNLGCLFQESQKSQLKARFMMIDSQPDVIDDLIHSNIHQFLDPFHMISGKQSASTYAAGYYRLKNSSFTEIFENSFKKIAEPCDNLESFLINHGIEGGTGSGTTALIMEVLSDIFPKIQKTNFLINYEPKQSNTPVGPINTILGLSNIHNHSDLLVNFDNYALNKLFHRNLDVKSPNYKNLNALISQIHSGYTLPMRFTDNQISCDIKEIQTNLVVFPRIKWIIPSFVPLINEQDADKGWGNILSSQLLIKQCFKGQCNLANQSYYGWSAPQMYSYGNRNNYKKISSVLLARGDFNENELQEKAHIAKSRILSDNLSPNLIKFGLNPHKSTRIHLNQINKRLKNTITGLVSSHQFSDIFNRISKNYDLLYSKKSFFHWFQKDKIGKDQLLQAKQELYDLQKTYEQQINYMAE